MAVRRQHGMLREWFCPHPQSQLACLCAFPQPGLSLPCKPSPTCKLHGGILKPAVLVEDRFFKLARHKILVSQVICAQPAQHAGHIPFPQRPRRAGGGGACRLPNGRLPLTC